MTNANTQLATLTAKLAARLDMGEDGQALVDTLKATTFKGQVTDAQMTALMVIANQYGLNPWTKEIYAFPDPKNGIVPVVGVDGWARIINSHPAFDGIQFEQSDDACICRIFRKDRSHPTEVAEYMSECRRNTSPWQSHPRRMLRHKAMIQCARIAFGFAGIYDPDEADRISDAIATEPTTAREVRPAELPPYPDEKFEENAQKWADLIESGKKTPEQLIAVISSKYLLSVEQAARIREMGSETAEG